MELIKVIAVRPVAEQGPRMDGLLRLVMLVFMALDAGAGVVHLRQLGHGLRLPDLAAMVSFHPIPAFSANEGDTNATKRTAAASAPCITAFIMNHLVL